MSRSALSLTYELAALQAAVEGARVLTEAAREQRLANPAEEQIALNGSVAILQLVGARMDLLGKVCYGRLDPSLLLSPFNEALPVEEGKQDESVGPVVTLPVWSEEQGAQHYERELARLPRAASTNAPTPAVTRRRSPRSQK